MIHSNDTINANLILNVIVVKLNCEDGQNVFFTIINM